MKTVIIGASGQLGRDLRSAIGGDAVPFTRADADLADHRAVREKLTAIAPQTVINCAAYNLVDKAEADPTDAFAVNAWAARNLAAVCRDIDARFVHISSDYVFGFNGARTLPLTENDLPGPVSNYGLSKLAGEYAVQAVMSDALVIRTCGLYGRHGVGGKGGNFVETMLRLGRERGAVKVVNDQHCTPTSTADLATAVVNLINVNAHGLVHVTNDGGCSWFTFASTIFKRASLTVQVTPISSSEFGAPARRPAYSVLSTQRYSDLTGFPMSNWSDALDRYFAGKSSENPASS